MLQPAYTIRVKPDHEAEQAVQDNASEVSLAWCGLTDTGRIREHNEDSFSCMDLIDGTVFVVADGMGGHDAGEVASRLAVETVCREISSNAADGMSDPAKLLEKAVQAANSEVLRQAVNNGTDMGTTLTIALIRRGEAYIANVGDSRTYWIENGSITQITEDHSLVRKLVSLGRLKPEEARTHPKSNVLYRTIGSEESVTVDIFTMTLQAGGSFLLCTDGLWGELTDDEIHAAFTENDAKSTCTKLVTRANENGGKDNITAVVVRVE